MTRCLICGAPAGASRTCARCVAELHACSAHDRIAIVAGTIMAPWLTKAGGPRTVPDTPAMRAPQTLRRIATTLTPATAAACVRCGIVDLPLDEAVARADGVTLALVVRDSLRPGSDDDELRARMCDALGTFAARRFGAKIWTAFLTEYGDADDA